MFRHEIGVDSILTLEGNIPVVFNKIVLILFCLYYQTGGIGDRLTIRYDSYIIGFNIKEGRGFPQREPKWEIMIMEETRL